MVNPIWNEVYRKLRYFNIDNDYDQRKSLLLTILNPEATKTGREILGLQEKKGINELDKYILIHRLRDKEEIIYFRNELLKLQNDCPSTWKNCFFILAKINPLIELCKEPPKKGIIHFNSRSKSNGYFITLYDIESNTFVQTFNMSKCPEYCNSQNNDYKFFSQFLAIEYVMNRCKETGENTYDLPIFPNDPNGDASYIDNTIFDYLKSRIQDDNLYSRLKKIIDRIDFNNFYLYENWHNIWGDIPTKKIRGRKVIKEIDLGQYF